MAGRPCSLNSVEATPNLASTTSALRQALSSRTLMYTLVTSDGLLGPLALTTCSPRFLTSAQEKTPPSLARAWSRPRPQLAFQSLPAHPLPPQSRQFPRRRKNLLQLLLINLPRLRRPNGVNVVALVGLGPRLAQAAFLASATRIITASAQDTRKFTSPSFRSFSAHSFRTLVSTNWVSKT